MQLIVIIETTKKGGVLATLQDERGKALMQAVAPNLLTWHNAGINLFNAAKKLNEEFSFTVSANGNFANSATKYFSTLLESLVLFTTK